MARSLLTRRNILLGVSLVIVGGTGALIASSQTLLSNDGLSVTEAYEAAKSEDLLLVDIRRPDEWEATGIGAGATPIDMRRDDFIAALDQLTNGDRSTPVALICARGVRSKHLGKALKDAGYLQVIDVPEGMLGSFAGPGWLKTGLPVTAYGG